MAATTAAHAYTINGKITCADAVRVPKGALVQAFDVDPVPGGSYSVSPALASGTVTDTGTFSLSFTWPSAGPGYEVGGPDLIFRVTQLVDGANETLFEEKPSAAHWNLADGATVSLASTSTSAVCSAAPGTIPNNNLFLFTRVGVYETANIDCKGSVATSSGYARPRKAPFSFTGADTDLPFGATLDLFGWFGKSSQIAYYKVQFKDAGGAWKDIDSPLPNYWYDTSAPNPLNWHWVSESMGPITDGGQSNLYKVPYLVKPNVPWSWLDRVVQFNTLLAADGPTRITIAPYKWNPAHTALVPATSADILIDPNYGEIVLQVDNTAPTVQILGLTLNGVSVPTCDVLKLGITAADKLGISFRVYDQRGHLYGYSLAAMYGHNQTVSPPPTTPNKAVDDYNANAGGSPSWKGSLNYSIEYNGLTYSPAKMPTCAYQFRLDASKRTTNGYGHIYQAEDTWHDTIQRP